MARGGAGSGEAETSETTTVINPGTAISHKETIGSDATTAGEGRGELYSASQVGAPFADPPVVTAVLSAFAALYEAQGRSAEAEALLIASAVAGCSLCILRGHRPDQDSFFG